MKVINAKIYPKIILIIFILIFCYQNILFISQDNFRSTDFQLEHAIDYYLFLLENPQVASNTTYPPLAYFATMPFFSIMGISQYAARISLFIFWIIFLIAMFGIGRELGDDFSGFTVMAISAASPHVLEYSRIYYIDFPQTACTAAALYFLLKSKGYKNRLMSFFAGITIALAFMAKWSAVFFLTIPVLWLIVPNIFKSWKSFQVFLVFTLTLFLSTAGTYAYFKKAVQMPSFIPFWYFNYILSFIVPALLCLFLTLKIDKNYREEETYDDSPQQKAVNFNLSLVPILLIVGIWISFSGKHLAMRFFEETKLIIDYSETGKNFTEFISSTKTMFNFFLVFIITGIYFMIKEKRKDLLLFIVSFVISFILILRSATYDVDPTRYFFTVIVFLAPLGGFWIKYAGKAKFTLTFLIVIISLISILAWTFIPGNLPLYYPVKYRLVLPPASFPMKILCTQPPNPVRLDFKNVIGYMKHDDDREIYINFFIIFDRDTKVLDFMTIREKLNLDIYKCASRVGFNNPVYVDLESSEFDVNLYKFADRSSIENLTTLTVLFVTKDGGIPKQLFNSFASKYKITGEVKKVNIGDKYWVTIIKINNDKFIDTNTVFD